MEVQIRQALDSDMPEVLELIKALAKFEKAPDEVEVTVDDLKQDGFGDEKIFDAFVATIDDKVVGFALYYMKYSTWKGKCLFLEDFLVREDLRGNGIGKLLFDEVVKVAKELKVRRMEWQVLDWNETAINFYNKYKSHLDGEWLNGKLVYDQLQSFNTEEGVEH